MKNIAILLCSVLILVSCTSAAPAPDTAHSKSNSNPSSIVSTPEAPTKGIPNFDHIALILLENRDYTGAIGNPKMPYLNALAQQYVLLSNYFAVRHPSLPNYIALMSGSTQNITKDCTDCFINQPNLADRIEAGGRTWKSYMEDMPSPCFIGDKAHYVQKHNPLLYFDSVRLNADRCNRSIVPLTELDADLAANQLPNFSFIMPNLCNSGYECDAQVTDTWVYNMVTKLQTSSAFGENSLIIIAFDEGNEHNLGSCCGLGAKAGGQVPAILISPLGQPGFIDNTAYSHYSVLKLILSAWNLPDLGVSASAPPILAPWEKSSAAQSAGQTADAAAPKPTTTTNCMTSSPPLGKNYTATLCYVDITDGSTLSGGAVIKVSVNTTDSAPGIQRVVFYLDGAYLLTDYQSPYTFTLPTNKWSNGKHVLSMEALLRDNFTTQQASLSVNFDNGAAAISPQANTGQFQPSTGTTPENGMPFTVVAGGDGAGGETNVTSISNLIASLNPNLFLYLGDVYERGSMAEFYNWYGQANSNFARFRSITDPTVGNHEYLTDGAAGYFDYWNNIPSYYSFNAGGWHFISLNSSNPPGEPVNPSSAQYQWLQKDLAANAGACTIAYYHHPLFNIGDEGESPYMKNIWNLLAQNKVEVIINGHDHDYQRWVPLDENGQPDPNGVTEFVAGASGHGLQTFRTSDNRVAFSSDTNPETFGVLVFQLNPNGTNFSYQTAEGETIDSGVIPCNPAAADTQAPTKPADLSATANGSTKVDLAWSASSDNTGVSGYTIYRDGSVVGTAPAGSQTYSDTTAAANTTYRYAIDAFDPAGNHSEKVDAEAVTTESMPDSLSFPVVADTYVSAASPQSNYGSLAAWLLDSSPDMRAYLRFNVQGLGKTPIKHARLLVYANTGTNQNISVNSISDSNWDELATNMTNAPAIGNTLASSGAFAGGNWVSLDVTPYVTGEGTYNFGLTTNSTTALNFRSREAGANAPVLILDFADLPALTPTPDGDVPAQSQPTPMPIPGAPGNQSLTFNPEADTYVSAESPDTNYGSAVELRANTAPKIRSYLRFKVHGLSGKSIAKARLMIFANSSSPQGLTAVAVADKNWDESSITYKNAPALGSQLASSEVAVSGDWITFDVTAYITGEDTYSFGITTPSVTAISLASRESASTSAPQLIIDLK